MSHGKKACLAVVAAVLAVSAGVLAVSIVAGLLPTTWCPASREAVERVNGNTAIKIGHLVKEIAEGQPGAAWNEASRLEAARQVSGLYEIGPNGRLPISMHESPRGPMRIIVQMTTTDSVGMVWAVTEHGETIKVFP